MLATIRNRNFRRIAASALLGLVGLGVNSCASRDPAPLINDPTAKKETSLPWNEQQQWEREGQAAELNQQRRN